jgi:aspartate aminotransferase/aminotransferase
VNQTPKPSANVSSIVEAMSIAFNTKVYELARVGRKVRVLSLGEAFFDLPPVDMSDLPYPQSFHYSHSRGIHELRQSIGEYYEARYGLPVDPEHEIILTAGSKVAIYMALLAVLDPDDDVLIPEPAWVSYSEQVRLCHGVPIGIPYAATIADWERYLTPRTKALIINNPHNPTGYHYTSEELQRIVDIARRHGLWLLSDEAYSDFTPADHFLSTGHFDEAKSHAIVFNSISKNYGISGWRLGYVIANSALTDQILKLNQHLVTCPATILQYYVAAHFHEILDVTKPQIRALLATRAEIAQFMDGLGLRYLPGDSTFYFFVSIAPSRLGSEEFCMRFLEEKLACVVPGIGYGASCDEFVRISVGTEPLVEIKRALTDLKEFIDETRS